MIHSLFLSSFLLVVFWGVVSGGGGGMIPFCVRAR